MRTGSLLFWFGAVKPNCFICNWQGAFKLCSCALEGPAQCSRPHYFFDSSSRPFTNFGVSVLTHALFQHLKTAALDDAFRDDCAEAAEVTQGPDSLAFLVVVSMLQQAADGIDAAAFKNNLAVAWALFANTPDTTGGKPLELVIGRWSAN